MSDELAKEIANGALGIEWRNTESAARRVAEYAADRIEELELECETWKSRAIHQNEGGAELEAKLAKAMDALDEAIYMLNPDERDMEKQAGVYRIVKAYEALTGKRVILADEGGKDE